MESDLTDGYGFVCSARLKLYCAAHPPFMNSAQAWHQTSNDKMICCEVRLLAVKATQMTLPSVGVTLKSILSQWAFQRFAFAGIQSIGLVPAPQAFL